MKDPELRKLVRDIVTEVVEIKKADELASAERADPRRGLRRLMPRQLTLTHRLSLILVGMWLTIIATKVWPEASAVIPDEIVGTWTTETPAYADRAFEITKTSVTFYSGESTFTTHLITGVSSVAFNNATLYTVEYVNLGEAYEFSFFYTNPPRGSIQFENQQDMTWQKMNSG
jgi:hypothetical protein